MVAQVVWEYLEEVAEEGEPLGGGGVPDSMAVDGDGDGSCG